MTNRGFRWRKVTCVHQCLSELQIREFEKIKHCMKFIRTRTRCTVLLPTTISLNNVPMNQCSILFNSTGSFTPAQVQPICIAYAGKQTCANFIWFTISRWHTLHFTSGRKVTLRPSVCVFRPCRKAVSTEGMQTSTVSTLAYLKHYILWLLREYH